MYQPEFTVRIEVAQTDVDTLREWRVVLGGAVRGGLSSSHGYMPTSGPLILDNSEDMLNSVKSLLTAYLSTLCASQLELELS